MSVSEASAPAKGNPAGKVGMLTEVKYSLPELLAELEAERGSASFAMEKLDQAEIGKLFKAKKPARAKPKN
ncbi:MAG TPA: hypothetical protein VGG34_07895 [Opitutaceae bacterium]|jgi:hypothetical protein